RAHMNEDEKSSDFGENAQNESETAKKFRDEHECSPQPSRRKSHVRKIARIGCWVFDLIPSINHHDAPGHNAYDKKRYGWVNCNGKAHHHYFLSGFTSLLARSTTASSWSIVCWLPASNPDYAPTALPQSLMEWLRAARSAHSYRGL